MFAAIYWSTWFVDVCLMHLVMMLIKCKLRRITVLEKEIRATSYLQCADKTHVMVLKSQLLGFTEDDACLVLAKADLRNMLKEDPLWDEQEACRKWVVRLGDWKLFFQKTEKKLHEWRMSRVGYGAAVVDFATLVIAFRQAIVYLLGVADPFLQLCGF